MIVYDGSDIFLLKGAGDEKYIAFSRVLGHLVIIIKLPYSSISAEKQKVAATTLPSNYLAYSAVKYEGKIRIPIVVDVREMRA